MTKYLIKISPLQDYFFGGERSNAFTQNKDGYFIESEDMPSQTTLLGLMRYLVLKQKGYLSPYKKRTESTLQKEQIRLIGNESFNINSNDQKFGIIKEVGPLFILDREQNFYVPTPFNHKIQYEQERNKTYTPFKMAVDEDAITDIGESIIFPIDFVSKEGITNSFVKLSDHLEIIDQEKIFTSIIKIGINRSIEENGFFKKKYKNLKEGWQFAFNVELDDDTFELNEIVYMGQEKSAFYLESKKIDDSNKESLLLKEKLKFLEEAQIHISKPRQEIEVYYALSDIYLKESLSKEMVKYSIIKKKLSRNLSTQLSSKDYFSRYKKSDIYELIRAGSTFFVTNGNEFKVACEKRQYMQIGLNHVVKIGGK